MERLTKFFREDAGAIIGAYFDGEKIFISRLTKKFETVEIEADGAEISQVAQKISELCAARGWQKNSVGFCLQDADAVTFQTEINNLPEKEIPQMVRSWAVAQAGAEAKFSFTKVGEEIWMEALPKTRAEEISAEFNQFGINLRGLSVMPSGSLEKIHPYERTEFITEIILNKTSPNLLTGGTVWNWRKIFCAAAAIFLIVLLIGSLKLLLEYKAAFDELAAQKIIIGGLQEELALKNSSDEIISELKRLNGFAAQIDSPEILNLLIKIGKVADKSVRLIKISAGNNFLELEGKAATTDALKNYLARVKNSVINSARLETSAEGDDGKISFVIRAALK